MSTQALAGVAGEQAAPQGKGLDVATLAHGAIVNRDNYDLTRVEESDGQRRRNALLSCLLSVRARLDGKDPGSRKAAPDVSMEQIHADIEARVEMGKQKYGERLTSHNGRSALMDLYQELIDAFLYNEQDIIEQGYSLPK